MIVLFRKIGRTRGLAQLISLRYMDGWARLKLLDDDIEELVDGNESMKNDLRFCL